MPAFASVLTELKATLAEAKAMKIIRAVKWVLPVFFCFLGFIMQSVMLHTTTMHYVVLHEGKNEAKPLDDLGHDILGHKHIPMTFLDIVSSSAFFVFVVGCLWLRDLRLWTKVFFCCGSLFIWKGVLDCITTLPDSIGWDECEARIKPEGVQFFKQLHALPSGEFARSFANMEIFGIEMAGGKQRMWPVRYCSDMLLSGHTFVMFLFLLASADLGRRLSLLLEKPGASWISTAGLIRVLVNMVVVCFVSADLYLIVVNHFHYTVDVVLAVLFTLLLYTNAAIAIFTDWYVEALELSGDDAQRHTSDNGLIWIPAFFFPFCCFTGFYEVREMDKTDVIKQQQQNKSKLHSALEQYIGYGSADP